jgi:Alpha-L-rhamnosidase N-terminal domain./Bacterial alpha-L-rhamnosidase.
MLNTIDSILNRTKGNSVLLPVDLMCEYAKDPIGIDVLKPRFSWKLIQDGREKCQTAYRIIVASKEFPLKEGIADLWDSGKIVSDLTIGLEYEGKKLSSGQKCYWKVVVWDKEGFASCSIETGSFEMGLIEQTDWNAEWISAEFDYPYKTFYTGPALYFRREFMLNKEIISARTYVSGLGYYEMSINGKKVGDHLLDPGFTDYDIRVLYSTYDVFEYINQGSNVIGVTVGNGFYCTPRWNGKPCLRMQIVIHFGDGTCETIKSDYDSGWLVAESPIYKNGIYDGERYDASLEMPGWDKASFCMENDNFKDRWHKVVNAVAPKGRMVSQMIEPIRNTEEIKPIGMKEPGNVFVFDPNPIYGQTEKPAGINRIVFDLGQNIAGWVRLKVEGPKGTKIVLKFSETLYFDDNLNVENLYLADAVDCYFLKGEGLEVYEPKFTYHGFRYVEVEGYIGEPSLDMITGIVVHSDIKRISEFNCSHSLLNQLYKNIIWTERDNLHSIPTDCCQRNERFGWLNDTTARCEETVYNFNAERLLSKWMDDIEDTQLESGAIADCAPYVWYGKRIGEPVDTTFVITQWLLYKHYGDKRILAEHYGSIKKWVDFLDSKAAGNILYHGWIGDWAPPRAFSYTDSLCSAISNTTTFEYISTCYYYYAASLMSQIAHVLDNKNDEMKYKELSEKIKKAFNEKFLDKKTMQYEMGSQAANAFALYLHLVPEEFKQGVINNLVDDLVHKNNCHLTTGNLCTKYLIEVLTEIGRHDVAWSLATQTTYPSWGYMIEKGATTIWERWEYEASRAMNSHNHPMYGSIGAWFMKSLVGIDIGDGVGFDQFIIHPQPVKGLEYVSGSLETVRGRIEVSVCYGESSFELSVAVPVNCIAKIRIPDQGWNMGDVRVYESNLMIWENGVFFEGVSDLSGGIKKKDYYEVKVGSGRYNFKMII